MARIDEIGGREYFDSAMIDRIRALVSENAMTPAVARDLVATFTERRQSFMTNVQVTHDGLENLGVQAEHLTAGSAELAFLIPRDLFDNRLDEFAKELATINLIIRQFSEVATGHAEPVVIHHLSSSEPILDFGLAAKTLAMIGRAISWLLETWKKAEEIKKLRQDSKKVGFSEADLKIFDDKIEKTVSQEIDKRAKELTERFPGPDDRRNELQLGIVWAMNSLLARVERGMIVEVRFLPPPQEPEPANAVEGETPQAEVFAELKSVSQELQFQISNGEPVLQLPPPEPPTPAVSIPTHQA